MRFCLFSTTVDLQTRDAGPAINDCVDRCCLCICAEEEEEEEAEVADDADENADNDEDGE